MVYCFPFLYTRWASGKIFPAFLEFVNFVFFLFPSDAVKFHLEELLEYKDVVIEEKKVDILVPIIIKYLDWLKKV